MELQIFKAAWGMSGTLEDQLQTIAQAGYDGVEMAVGQPQDGPKFQRLLERYKLRFIGMIFVQGLDVTSQAADFRRQLAAAAQWHPVKLTVHSGRDCFTLDDSCRFYESALEAQQTVTFPVAHETHRGRAFFTPWTTAAVLERLPELELCCDFSHWVCVCESLLDPYEEAVRTAIEHVQHIHGRVGYEEGPQTPDPSAPEYAVQLARHEQWWDSMFAHQKSLGRELVTFTPEFGPPGYMHTLPHTNQPVANLWDVCLWMAARARQRFAAHFAQ